MASLWDSKDEFLSENEGDLFASAEENQSMRSFTSFSNPFTCALNSIVSIHPCWYGHDFASDNLNHMA